MKQKFSQEKQQEQQSASQETRQNEAREFASPEEMLRFDASQTAVPPGLEARLKQSAAHEPFPKGAPPGPWWKKIFGR